MSTIISTMYGGAYSQFGQMYQLTDEAPESSKAPELGAVANQSAAFRMPKASGPMSFEDAFNRVFGQNGLPVSVNGNQCSWTPGGGLQFNRLSYRAYQTYRAMDDDPTLQIVIRMILDPILTAVWSVEGVDDNHPEWVDFIKAHVLPQLQGYLKQALRSLSFGWQPFEKVWELADGGKLGCRLRAMYPDYASIYLNSTTKQFAGLAIGGTKDLLPPNKSLIITYNGEATDLYGHSKHDAAYAPYCNEKQTEMDLIKLRAKLSGILPILKFPPGIDPITKIDNRDLANQILQTLGLGYGVAMPSIRYTAQQIASNPKLLNESAWELTFHDSGSLTPAITGYLAVIEKYNVDKFRAWGMPERAGMEGSHGTKAEAGVHSDNVITSKELIAQEMAYQITHGNPTMGVTGLIDDLLLYNFGSQAVGSVELKCAPLADNKLAYKAELMQQILSCNNPALVEAFLKIISVENTVEQLGIPLSGDGTFVDAFAQAKKAIAAAQVNVPPQEPTITPPGGSKGPAKVAAALQMASAA